MWSSETWVCCCILPIFFRFCFIQTIHLHLQPDMNPSSLQTNPYSDLFRAQQQSQAQFIPNAGNSNTYNYGATPLPPTSTGQMPMVNTPDLAMIARQGYLQQQQRLAQMGQMGQMGIPNLMPPRGGTPQQGQSSVYMGITPEMREKQAMEAAARETMLREKAMRDAVLNEAAKKRARVSICFSFCNCVFCHERKKLIKLGGSDQTNASATSDCTPTRCIPATNIQRTVSQICPHCPAFCSIGSVCRVRTRTSG